MRPRAFRRRGRRTGTTKVVVCAGDSLTHGIVSFNYVRLLESEFGPQGYEFVNAGVSGNLAYNLLVRLDEVIACKPDVVTVLVGGNDVAAHISDEWMASYLRVQRPSQRPSLTFYREQLAAIVTRLLSETSAQVALVEIAPITEDLKSEENLRVAEYNTAVHDVGAAAGVPVLPLNHRLASALPVDHRAPAFDGTKRLMGRASFAHWLLGRSWDSISQARGFALYTDHLHLNSRGARIVADQIADYLRSLDGSAAP